jgi:hypothetical protein
MNIIIFLKSIKKKKIYVLKPMHHIFKNTSNMSKITTNKYISKLFAFQTNKQKNDLNDLKFLNQCTTINKFVIFDHFHLYIYIYIYIY